MEVNPTLLIIGCGKLGIKIGSDLRKQFDVIGIKRNTISKFHDFQIICLNIFDPAFDEILIIGSLLEKEGIDYQDKKKIYSVIMNRLKLNMKLQIDATVIFSLTGDKRDFDRKLTYDDLKIQNPYNTYMNFGLPPGPISYVGHKTIELIFEDYKKDYLFYFYNYFVNKHIFSLNYKDHLERLNEYRSKK